MNGLRKTNIELIRRARVRVMEIEDGSAAQKLFFALSFSRTLSEVFLKKVCFSSFRFFFSFFLNWFSFFLSLQNRGRFDGSGWVEEGK